MRRRVWAIVAQASAFVVACSVLLAGASPVRASCATGRPHDDGARYAITSSAISSLTGVSASILEYDPSYSGYNDTGTNATIMLANSAGTRWAQWGWFKSQLQTPGTTRRQVGLEFYISASDNTFEFWPGRSIGSVTKYRLYYTSSRYDFYLNDVGYSSHTGNPAPGQYQIFGETHDAADQMPGGYNAPETFTSAKYYTSSSHTSHTVTSAIHTQSIYGADHPSSGAYEIWDWACAT